MKNIKTIIFDFGGVILNIDYNKTSKAFFDLGVLQFESMYSQKNADPVFELLEKGKLGEQEFYDAFRKSAQLPLSDQQIKTAWNAMLLGFRKEALQTLKEIKSKYKLFMLSNTNRIHEMAVTKMYEKEIGTGSIHDYFIKIYYSHEIGFRKPGKEPYEHVLKENGLIASETLFIDDSIQNIEAAQSVGLQTIFLKEGMGIEDLEL
jgi:putative hydrolase of the HAD superfamily